MSVADWLRLLAALAQVIPPLGEAIRRVVDGEPGGQGVRDVLPKSGPTAEFLRTHGDT